MNAAYSGRRRLQVVLAERRELATDVVGLWLAPAAEEAPLVWQPGQFLEILLDDGRRRAFSIANGPRPDGLIELHLRRSGAGGFTDWACEQLGLGDRLCIEGPRGAMVPCGHSDRPMLFVAGGTGFAPVKALVEHFMRQDTRRTIGLYWGVRSVRDFYLLTTVERWVEQAHDLRFHAVVSDPQEAPGAGLRTGLVHEMVLADHPNLSGHEVYMSGPAAMIQAGRTQFMLAGLSGACLHYDV